MTAVNDLVTLDSSSSGLNDKTHPALQNAGIAVVHRISLDGKTIWVQPHSLSPIFPVPSAAVSGTSTKGPLPRVTVPTTRKTTLDEHD